MMGTNPSPRRLKHHVSDVAVEHRWWGELARILTATSRYLRAGTHSAQDVRDYLRHRGVPSALVQRVIVTCQARGLLDDRACAQLLADHWARDGYAWTAIAARLAARGLEAHAVTAGRAVGITGADDAARARELISRSTRGAVHTVAARVRLVRLLAARGFDEALIEQVVTEIFGSIPSHAES